MVYSNCFVDDEFMCCKGHIYSIVTLIEQLFQADKVRYEAYIAGQKIFLLLCVDRINTLRRFDNIMMII